MVKNNLDEQAREYVANVLERHREHGIKVQVSQKELKDAVAAAKKLTRRADRASKLAA